MSERRSYGSECDQFFTASLPRNNAPLAAAALVHGGYWRQRFTSSLMAPLEEALLSAGWMTFNIEYRRGPDHPWPIPSNDVGDALGLAADIAHGVGVDNRFVSIGHSVGGQLVLLNHQPVDAVVALAPVTDTSRVYTEGLGDDAAIEYFQVSPESDPDLYRSASPRFAPPPTVPTLIVQGTSDDRVPSQHTEDYLRTIDAQSYVEAHHYEGVGHIDLIDPDAEHWASTLKWMSSAVF